MEQASKFVKNDKVYIYIKRLGQRHYALSGESRTLCEMPMLGSNYAKHYYGTPDLQEECEECARKSMIMMVEEDLLGNKE